MEGAKFPDLVDCHTSLELRRMRDSGGRTSTLRLLCCVPHTSCAVKDFVYYVAFTKKQ